MTKIHVLMMLALALPVLASGGSGSKQTVVPDPTPPGTIKYINPMPPKIAPPRYPGQYYDAWVPATLDLAERARLSVNAMTEMVNPNMDYEMYTATALMADPPTLAHATGDLATQGKYFEAIPLVRSMCGSDQNLDVEYGMMKIFLKMQGPDGLIYTPTSGRPWVGFFGHKRTDLPQEDSIWAVTETGGSFREGVDHVSCLGYGNGRALGGFFIYAQKDPDGPWSEAARRLAEGFMKTVIVEGENAYIFDEWTMPGRPVVKPPARPLGMVGGVAPWVAKALIQYDRFAGDPQAAELAQKMIHYVMGDLNYFTPDGRFLSDYPSEDNYQWAHFHTHGMGIIGALYHVERTSDEEMLERALKAYHYGIRAGEPLLGYFPEIVSISGAEALEGHLWTSESCEVSDMIIAAVLFSKRGIDKWDDVDRWVRNQFAENQVTWTNWVTDGRLDRSHISKSGHQHDFFHTPGRYTNDRVAQRAIGSFAGQPGANDLVGYQNYLSTSANCCTGSGARALYYVWLHNTGPDIAAA